MHTRKSSGNRNTLLYQHSKKCQSGIHTRTNRIRRVQKTNAGRTAGNSRLPEYMVKKRVIPSKRPRNGKRKRGRKKTTQCRRIGEKGIQLTIQINGTEIRALIDSGSDD